MIKRYLFAVVLVLIFGKSLAAAENTPVNIAGQQRMLSQRIVKAYCQIGLNITPVQSGQQLDAAVSHFEKNLLQLARMARTSSARHALEALDKAWQPLRKNAQGKVSQALAPELDLQAENVLVAAERLTRILQDESATPVSRWINLAGRQRMLSQRLVKAYMLRQWGADSSSTREQLDSASNEFSGALANMYQRPENTREILTNLNALTVQWEWMHNALAAEGSNTYRLILAEGSESIINLSDKITTLIEQQER